MSLPAWLAWLRPAPAPAADPLVVALQAEIARGQEREKALLAQVSDLVKELAALADTKAHLAATRQPATEQPERKQPTARMPAYANSSVRGGHANLRDIRETRKPKAMSKLPPIAHD